MNVCVQWEMCPSRLPLIGHLFVGKSYWMFFYTDAEYTPLGGTGKTVEIDESKFGRRKYHRGRHAEGAWVFGAYEKDIDCVLMTVVSDRFAATLGDFIQKWIFWTLRYDHIGFLESV